MAKFIFFEHDAGDDYGGKPIWRIYNKKSESEMALCLWYSPWKRYVARFYESSVWSDDCLDDVSAALKNLNAGKEPE